MGLGGFPDVTLARAREAARDARAAIRDGIDPIEAGRQARRSLIEKVQTGMSFRQAAEAFVSAHSSSWKNEKHRDQWTSTLRVYAYPVLADVDVSGIELAHILRVLEPIWLTKTETAKRVRGRLERVLDWAAARDLRSGPNPARWRGHLDKLLANPSKVRRVMHHRALPVDEMPAFMRALREQDGTGARALEFAILTAARSGEVRGCSWKEFDLEKGIWIVPGERMKAGREHRVPLSTAAQELVMRQPQRAHQSFLFKASDGGPLSDMTLSAVLRRMKVEAVPHGFRSTFRDWAAERTAHASEVAEMALAHVVGNKVEAAYRRGDMVEKRRQLMEDWAVFILGSA
jgi:integrase